MGRKRSNFICPKCGLQGSLRYKWTRNGEFTNSQQNHYRYVEHFSSFTRTKTTCYVESILREQEFKVIALPNWDFILLKGFERIELNVKKWEGRNKRILQFVTDPVDRKRIQALLASVRNIIFFEEVPYLLAHVLSHKGKLNQQEEFLLNESKNYLLQQAKIKKELQNIMKLPMNKNLGKFNLSDKRVMEVAENSVQAFQFMKNPFFKALDQWYSKYGRMVADQKRREYKKKLSEGAFGTNKYPGQYTGLLVD